MLTNKTIVLLKSIYNNEHWLSYISYLQIYSSIKYEILHNTNSNFYRKVTLMEEVKKRLNKKSLNDI